MDPEGCLQACTPGWCYPKAPLHYLWMPRADDREKDKCDVMFIFKKPRRKMGKHELIRSMSQLCSWDKYRNKRTRRSLGATSMDLPKGSSAWPICLHSLMRWLALWAREGQRIIFTLCPTQLNSQLLYLLSLSGTGGWEMGAIIRP